MFGRTLRFLFALPVALVATAGLYYFWFSSFLKSECVRCYDGSAEFYDELVPVSPWLDKVIESCCWIDRSLALPQADPSNSYTRHDKASPEPPEPIACDEDCDMSKIEIPGDALSVAPTIQSRGVIDSFAPAYPRSCLAKGVSGAVIAEFDVTPEGSTANARIISSPDKCFNAEVLRAISKFRYPPATDEAGRAVWRRGVRETITFDLEG